MTDKVRIGVIGLGIMGGGDHHRRGVNTRSSLNPLTHAFDEVARQRQQVHTDQSDNGFSVCQHEGAREQIIVDSLAIRAPLLHVAALIVRPLPGAAVRKL